MFDCFCFELLRRFLCLDIHFPVPCRRHGGREIACLQAWQGGDLVDVVQVVFEMVDPQIFAQKLGAACGLVYGFLGGAGLSTLQKQGGQIQIDILRCMLGKKKQGVVARYALENKTVGLAVDIEPFVGDVA